MDDQQPLSPNALLLLDYLRRWAPRPELARTDRVIANALHLPERVIVDLADELLRAGFTTDSSIQPVRHPDYGVPRAPTLPYRLCGTHGDLLELPPLTWDVFGRHVPVGGGGYLRLFPLALLRAGLRQKERAGAPGCLYLHPWEVDPGQPRVAGASLKSRFRHYTNLHKTEERLDRLLGEFAWDRFDRVLGLA